MIVTRQRLFRFFIFFLLIQIITISSLQLSVSPTSAENPTESHAVSQGILDLGTTGYSCSWEKNKAQNYIPGEIIIKYKEELSIDELVSNRSKSLEQHLGIPIIEHSPLLMVPEGKQLSDYPLLNRYYLIKVPCDSDVSLLSGRLAEHPSIEFSTLNHILQLTKAPNDERFVENDQWALKDTVFANLQFEKAWDITTGGENIIVAVIDSGVDLDHPELDSKLIPGKNYFAASPPQDDMGHGTSVAGIIGAETNNQVGVAAVSWGSRIMPIKVCIPAGRDSICPFDYIFNSIVWAADQGADIINMSIAWEKAPVSEFDAAILQGAVDYAHNEKQVLVVVSAGNSGQYLDSSNSEHWGLSELDHVLVVGATNKSDKVCADINSVGEAENCGWESKGSGFGPLLDVVAPGSLDIVTTDLNGYRDDFGGTSAATPFVSGLAALMLSVNPNLLPNEVETLIKESTVGPGFHDYYYGWGRIDAFNAVTAAKSYVRRPSLLTPFNGATGIELKPSFVWNPQSDATSYEIEISPSSSFSSNVIRALPTNPSFVPNNNLTTATTYYWRVRGWRGFAHSEWSAVWSFTTRSDNNPPPQGWKVDYYNGKNFDSYAQTAYENTEFIDHDWSTGSPGHGVGADNFSIRYERTVYFDRTGLWKFTIRSNDGFRLYVDGEQLPSEWWSGYHDVSPGRELTAGYHTIKLEYFEDQDNAKVYLRWQHESPPPEGNRVRLYRQENYVDQFWSEDKEGFNTGPSGNVNSIDVPSGWSVWTYREDNQSSESRCWNADIPDLELHGWKNAIQAVDIYHLDVCPPKANFDAWPLSGHDPDAQGRLKVSFHNISKGNITSCLWDYGDGTTGTTCRDYANYHDHTYLLPGTYTVSLTVSGLGGSDTQTRTDYITVSGSSNGTPNAPANVQATDGTLLNRVRVTWNASANTLYYGVFAHTEDAPNIQHLQGLTGATSYEYYPVAPDQVYFHWVVACNDIGCSDYGDHDIGYAQTFDEFCDSVTQIPSNECEALVALYQNTNGFSWFRKDGWLDTNTPCSWFGILCDGSHVVGIYLDDFGLGNNLIGTIPPSLAELEYLEQLVLSNNFLTGNIPAELGLITSLANLQLDSNQLNGLIPPEMGNLVNLQHVDLSDNQFIGHISPQLGNLTQLKSLNLSQNQLTGPIPNEIGFLVNLTYLNLSDNHIIGGMPTWLGNLTELRSLYLDRNHLTGPIPSQLGNLTHLTSLVFSNNALNGRVPLEITNLVNIGNNEFNITDFSYNALIAEGAVAAFLDEKDQDWSHSQTISPTGLRVTNVQPNSVQLSWTPIPYTEDGGYYEIAYSTSPIGNGQEIVHGKTNNKAASTYLVDGLSPGKMYYFAVRTFTPAHDNQQNQLLSDYTSIAGDPPHSPLSDDFNCGLNTDLWTFVNPLNDGSYEANGSNLRLTVPAGVSHNPWTDGNKAPRMMQSVNNPQVFGAEVKFESAVTQQYQMQGMMAAQDEQNFIRFEYQHNGGGTPRVHVAAIQNNGTQLSAITLPGPLGATSYLRMTRADSVWTFAYSANGTDWTLAGGLDFDAPINQVGVFSANHNPGAQPAPAHTAVIDYFFNSAAPIVPEDDPNGCAGNQSSVYLPMAAVP